MLPHKHFLVSGIFVAIAALIVQIDIKTAVLWIIVGGLVSAFIDIDSLCLLMFTRNKKLKKFRSIREIFGDYDGLISTFKEMGALKLLSITHLMISIAILIITLLFFADYLVPVLAGITPHLFTDLLLFVRR
jgi:hypothetical protein